ncbi:hypothetical protein Caci_7437 [Catenulispora acidiphila DSM 44928]|uniref:Uncharacterized protein n=1 Tax=Catenulispora acidiphila (strain DSM 44928 / JCM 14897 / NBRC 102108 / NRRL B-24433 / ID139908) TaxID=479433 RepID=C7Q9U3_CATAD|nr:hypothetical protein Caci_7437 [Catenulispora acidiphila DSM 44928]
MRAERVPAFPALYAAMASGQVETAGNAKLVETFVRVFAPPAAAAK